MLPSDTKTLPATWLRDLDVSSQDEDLGLTMLATSTVVYGCCTIFVLARILLRLRLLTKPTSEDYLTVLALVGLDLRVPFCVETERSEPGRTTNSSAGTRMGRGCIRSDGHSTRTRQAHHDAGSRRSPLCSLMVHDWVLSHAVVNIAAENGCRGAPRAPDEPFKSPYMPSLEPSWVMLSCAFWTHTHGMDPLQSLSRLPECRHLSKLFYIRWK